MTDSSSHRILIILARLTVIGSICGCCWQIWDITDDYFAKEVVTEIKIEAPDEMVLPDISFCARLPHFIKYTRLETNFPEMIQVIQRKFPQVNDSFSYSQLMSLRDGYFFLFDEITQRYKLDEIVNVLYTHDDLFADVFLLSNKHIGYATEHELNNDCEFKRYAKELDICIRFSCAKHGRYTFTNEDLATSMFKEEVVEFDVYQDTFKLIPHLTVILHEPDSYPWGHQVASVLFASRNDSYIHYFSYKRFEANLMPPPHSTDCQDYEREGYLSQMHKFETCENQRSLETLGCPFYGNIHDIRLNAWHGYRYYNLQFHNETVQKLIKHIHDECSKAATRPDCKDEYFVPKEKFPRLWKGNYSKFILTPPTEPDIIQITKEKLPFTEWLIFVESVFGTWFGFCVAGTLPVIYRWAITKAPKARKALKSKKFLKPRRLRVKTYN